MSNELFRQNTLERDSIYGGVLIFEVWCTTREKNKSSSSHEYIEKEWKVCERTTEAFAKAVADKMQKKYGWGFRGGVNTTGRRYFVKFIRK